MERAIAGFVQDDTGDVVAVLECGHRQHVRHRPPMTFFPWVETEAGRREKIGAPLDCSACDMPQMPAHAQRYKTTAVFDALSVPAGLLRAHATKAGTWGKIVVLEGTVNYVLEGVGRWALNPDTPGIIPPQALHHVSPTAMCRFCVEFWRVGEA